MNRPDGLYARPEFAAGLKTMESRLPWWTSMRLGVWTTVPQPCT
jgi:hypothetical protein